MSAGGQRCVHVRASTKPCSRSSLQRGAKRSNAGQHDVRGLFDLVRPKRRAGFAPRRSNAARTEAMLAVPVLTIRTSAH
jgi:hypothetical protein